MRRSTVFLLVLCCGATSLFAAGAERFDVVVYGGSSCGVIAAVQAAQMNQWVALVCPERHLGGLTSAGLGSTDSGHTRVIGGLAKAFYRRVWQKYQEASAWPWQAKSRFGNRGQGRKAMDDETQTMGTFAPHIAEAVFDDWPQQLYIREARRLIGDYVMTEHEVLGQRAVPNPVGMGSYTMDSHNVQRYVKANGMVENEGDIGVKPKRPYAIALASLHPLKGVLQDLLVPVAISSTHIAYGSIRMEPVFTVLGQSAATLAVLSLERGVPVQDVPYGDLRERLLADGQVLSIQSF